MQSNKSPTKQAHADGGHGVVRTVTQARGGVRRGMTKVLVISMLLTAVAIGAVWLLSPLRATHMQQPYPTAALASAPQPNALKSRAWDQAHLGAYGLEKCSAFRKVLDHTTELASPDHGPMSSSERIQLDAELNTAKLMPPVALTPLQCGVPLG